jgi:RimJ/RimL family protein N-acetyltransferase
LHEIKAEEVTPEIAGLFSPNVPSPFRCFSVLAGLDAGKILVDNPRQPTRAAVQEAGDGTLYLGGQFDAPALQELVNRLRRGSDVLLGFHYDDPIGGILPPDPDYVGTTLEFFDRPAEGSGLEKYLTLPDGYELRQMDAELLARSVWYEDTLRVHGSAENFLARGVGVCLLHGDVIACEASAGVVVLNTREMGVYTHPEHRNRGIATTSCAHLIRQIEQAGNASYWNCASQNLPSAAIARKLSYRTHKEYRLLAWNKFELA